MIKVSKRTYKTLTRIARVLDCMIAIITLVIVLAADIMAAYTVGISLEASTNSAIMGQAYEDAKSMHPAYQQEYIDEVYLNVQEARQDLYHRNQFNEWFFLENSKLVQVMMLGMAIAFAICSTILWYQSYIPKRAR